MNERIKELAEQAGLRTELWNNPEPFIIYKEDVHNPGGLEKFTNLLIKECGKIADAYRDEHLRSLPSNVIKEYFGVTE